MSGAPKIGSPPQFSTTVEKTVENPPVVTPSTGRIAILRIFDRGERAYGRDLMRLCCDDGVKKR
jgi:hypothetical protein